MLSCSSICINLFKHFVCTLTEMCFLIRPEQLFLLLDFTASNMWIFLLSHWINVVQQNLVRFLRAYSTISAVYYIDVELVSKMFCWRHMNVYLFGFAYLFIQIRDCFRLWLGNAIMMSTRTQTDWLLLFWFFCFKYILLRLLFLLLVLLLRWWLFNTKSKWMNTNSFLLHCWFYILHVQILARRSIHCEYSHNLQSTVENKNDKNKKKLCETQAKQALKMTETLFSNKSFGASGSEPYKLVK